MVPKNTKNNNNLYLIIQRVLTIWPVLLSTVCSQHPVPSHPSPQRSRLLCWGDGWVWTGSINQSIRKIFNVSRITMLLRGPRDVVIRVGHQGMISEIDTSSVVDETESTKVTTESQMGCWYRRICTPYGLPAAAAARITAIWSNLWPRVKYSSSRQGDVTNVCLHVYRVAHTQSCVHVGMD